MDLKDFDWRQIAGAVAQFAPTIGGVLGTGFGGPLGGIIGSTGGKILASYLGVAATPEAVGRAIVEDPQAAEKLARADAEKGEEFAAWAQVEVERLKQETEQQRLAGENTAGARAAQLDLVERGSVLAYGPSILSGMIVIGFFGAIWLFMARPPTMTEATLSIVSLLIGKLSSSFDTVVQYYLGSSAGSKNKDDVIRAQAVTTAAAAPAAAAAAAGAVKAIVARVKR